MSEATEFAILQRLLPELEAEGYDVYINPNRPLVPAFLGDFSPDAIALRDDKNLLVEILRPSPRNSDKLERIKALLEGQKNWELRVVWVTPNNKLDSPPIQHVEAIEDKIAEIKDLARMGHHGPALLLAWATFEALARAALTGQFTPPQTPGRLVQVLASEGYLTPSEADQLRALADKRNRLVHGELQVSVSDADIKDFAAVLETMLGQLPH